MTDIDDVFERARLWPVRLVLTAADGVTLWGPAAADEPDRVLVIGSRLALFDRPEALTRFVANGDGGPFAGTPGLAELRAGLDGRPLEPTVTADYRAVAAALQRPAAGWDRSGLGDLLDAFNLLGDVAASLPGAGLDDVLDDPGPARPTGPPDVRR